MAGRPQGHPKTGGRCRGTPNKRTVARERAAAAAAEHIAAALGPDAFQGDAHAVLIAIYKDVRLPVELRLDAARAAIGYEKSRLAAVEAKVDGRMTLEQLVLGSMRHRQRSE
jgi:hypothetical protein